MSAPYDVAARDGACPACQARLGGHTLDQMAVCATEGYSLPFEELPADVKRTMTFSIDDVAGSVDVVAGWTATALGNFPVLSFHFWGTGLDGTARDLGVRTILMDSAHLKDFRHMVSAAVDSAVVKARRRRS